MSLRDMMKGASNAELFEKSKYFAPGQFLVELTNCKYNEGQKTAYIIEGKVLGARNTGPEAPAVGEHAAHIIVASGDKTRQQMALRDVIGFMCSIFDLEPGDKSDEEWFDLAVTVFEDNELAGTVALLECHEITTKNDRPFTIHTWRGIASDADKAEFGL